MAPDPGRASVPQPSGVAVLDDALRVVYVDEQMASASGREPGALAGLTPSEALGPIWDVLEAECLNVLASGEPVTVLAPDAAASAHEAIRCRAVRRPDGSVSGLELVSLSASPPDRSKAQPVDALARLVGGIAHDFNNMLTAIGGYTGLVRDELARGDRRRNDLDEALKAVARARSMVLRLLAFAEGRHADRELVAVDEVTRELERLLRHVVGEAIQLHTKLASDSAVFMRVGELEQILVNLALNARDAMPDGGSLTVATSAATFDAPIAHGLTRAPAGDYVAIAVADTGRGMDAATQKRVFESHFTTKAYAQGAGLGLASVLASVEEAGGDLVLTSGPDGGALFELYLPRVPAPEPAAETFAPVPLGSEDVVVVVDDDQVRSATVRMLESLGYATVGVGTGDEADELCRQAPSGPDLLIIDAGLPATDVRELARSRQAAAPSLKVLYVGNASAATLAWPLLVKPFDQRALGLRVRGVLDGS